MSGFAPGDEVICVDDEPYAGCWREPFETWPVQGRHYTIRDVEIHDDCVSVRLNEVRNPTAQYIEGMFECTFRAERFRPVRRQAVEDFKRMAAGISGKQLADVEG